MAKNKNLVADISEFQTNVDYKGLSEQVLFTWLRISDGATYYDHMIEKHINGFKKAKANNYGFYWFLRPNNYEDGKSEAAQVLKWIKEYEDITKTGRPLMLDIEQFTNTSGTMRQAVQGCIDYLLKAGVKKEQIWLYIDNSKYNQFNINTKGFKTIVPTYAYMDRTVNSPYWDLLPQHGQQLWQYTCTFSSPYVQGNLDMSVFCNDGKPEMLYPFKANKPELPPLSKNPTYYHSEKTKAITIKRSCAVYDNYAFSKAKKLKTLQPSNKEFKILKWWEQGEKPNQLSRLYIEYENGKKGWITGSLDYVNSVYYLASEYSGKKYIEATQDQYIAEYNDLSGRLTKIKKGDRFKVEANISDKAGYARFKLSNGKYASARKNHWKFVK